MNTHTSSVLLTFKSINKSFGRVKALSNVSIEVKAGTIHALLGGNGAGKSSLLRVAFGLLKPDSGSVEIKGHFPKGYPLTPSEAINAGLGMVHQHRSLIPALTVAENIALGNQAPKTSLWNRLLFNESETARAIVEKGKQTGLILDPNAKIDTLATEAQQKCEILKALMRNAQVLMLDEPASVLTPQEGKNLFSWLREYIRKNPSSAVILVTHRLQDALDYADTISVMRQAEVVITAPASELNAELLAEKMFGSDLQSAQTEFQNKKVTGSRDTLPTVMHLKDVNLKNNAGALYPSCINLDIKKGEVLGIAAPEGSGHNELLRIISRTQLPLSGNIHGTDSISYVPAERKKYALMNEASLTENFALHCASKLHGRVNWTHISEQTKALIEESDVVASGPHSKAYTLSGGNQQKFVIARALSSKPEMLVIDNPTNGLDIKAAVAVHKAIRKAANDGLSVVLYSSDIDETLALSDSVLVLKDGGISAMVSDRTSLLAAMASR